MNNEISHRKNLETGQMIWIIDGRSESNRDLHMVKFVKEKLIVLHQMTKMSGQLTHMQIAIQKNPEKI